MGFIKKYVSVQIGLILYVLFCGLSIYEDIKNEGLINSSKLVVLTFVTVVVLIAFLFIERTYNKIKSNRDDE